MIEFGLWIWGARFFFTKKKVLQRFIVLYTFIGRTFGLRLTSNVSGTAPIIAHVRHAITPRTRANSPA